MFDVDYQKGVFRSVNIRSRPESRSLGLKQPSMAGPSRAVMKRDSSPRVVLESVSV